MLTRNEALRQWIKVVHGDGTPCDYGCTEEKVDAMIARARQLYPQKPYCVVADWTWGDIEIDPRQADEVAQEGVLPAFVYGGKIIRDEADRWAEGACVRTTLLVAFHDECIFSTRNSNYILLGPGARLTVGPSVYNGFHF